MKNPLILFSALFGTSTVSTSLTEAATLEFCYDHVTDDFSVAQQNQPLLAEQSDFQVLRIQETE